MNAEIQRELIKKIVRDWALDDKAGAVDALIAIMEVLDYDPYDGQRAVAHEASGGG